MRLKFLFLIILVLFPITVGVRVAAQATATPSVILYPTVTARPRTATPRVTASLTPRPTATATFTPTATATFKPSATLEPSIPPTLAATDESSVLVSTDAATSAATDAASPVQVPVIPVDGGTGILATEPAIGVPEGVGTELAATDAATPAATDVGTPETAETLAATGEPDQATPAPIVVATEPSTPAETVRVGVVVYQDIRGDARCQGDPVMVGEPVEFQVGAQTFQVRTNNDGLALAGEFPRGTQVEARYVGKGLLSGPAKVQLESGDETPCAFGLTSLSTAAQSNPGLSWALVLAGVAAVLVILSVAVFVGIRMSN